jgi:hypothetical protein
VLLFGYQPCTAIMIISSISKLVFVDHNKEKKQKNASEP